MPNISKKMHEMDMEQTIYYFELFFHMVLLILAVLDLCIRLILPIQWYFWYAVVLVFLYVTFWWYE